ncbi:het-c2 protein [Cryptococcus neoformans]|uniref:Het-c2 protein n=2 Tax=Cryptococcus neoformans TaxID=5207 RepID=A0A854QHG9_CRYNE|nr:het-c2 protein [Cryptococcus neoformans var. grubii H99]AUB28260.1 het-c2 protein [Cryptococcus neoformans var. grubii]OWT37170.1 het-c2 protein [Cryptococcus neoformans var. grubii Bt1]OWZ29523.1 het-c2 protein [Cryptococcus neoformans var. grubii c45]OWZ30387.1 het-c2 protein [Cryptococcus neoformans var. grubii AD1-83a]OWZ33807.1 het-c2 protein [Cryptococcus neoformans var. grubii AD2-60a]OWZ45935.1 het-c2 protein [Cryptococcus neoformans var. grubii C23]OWZ56138.1 het-c2 protein [Cryp|eukprot:XP_012052873.1 het-c2 protein [Cryptococcus neoformans var. grubii H99]
MSEQQFFETITKSFTDVTITEQGVDTAEFLEAAEGLVKIFNLFGNPAFAVVQNDLTGNIAKIRAYLAKNPSSGATLESLLASEKANIPKAKDRVATDALMWLLRGLKFTSLGLKINLENKDEELSASFTKAYEQSLKKYHGMMIRPVFYLAMKACPYRATFYPKLGQPQEEVMPKLEAWLKALYEIVEKEEGVFKAGSYGEI